MNSSLLIWSPSMIPSQSIYLGQATSIGLVIMNLQPKATITFSPSSFLYYLTFNRINQARWKLWTLHNYQNNSFTSSTKYDAIYWFPFPLPETVTPSYGAVNHRLCFEFWALFCQIWNTYLASRNMEAGRPVRPCIPDSNWPTEKEQSKPLRLVRKWFEWSMVRFI